MRILEEIPEMSLGGGAGAAPEVFLLFSLLLVLRQEPPGPVVSVLTAGLHVEIIQAPVLQLLTEVLNTNTGGKMELSISVQAQNGIKVPR